MSTALKRIEAAPRARSGRAAPRGAGGPRRRRRRPRRRPRRRGAGAAAAAPRDAPRAAPAPPDAGRAAPAGRGRRLVLADRRPLRRHRQRLRAAGQGVDLGRRRGPHRRGRGGREPGGQGRRRAVPASTPSPTASRSSQADAALATARRQCRAAARRLRHRQGQLEAAKAILEIRQREFDRQQSNLQTQGIAAERGARRRRRSPCSRPRTRGARARRTSPTPRPRWAATRRSRPTTIPAVRAALAARDAARAQPRQDHGRSPRPPASSARSRASTSASSSRPAPPSRAWSRPSDTWVEANFKETQLDGLASACRSRSGRRLSRASSSTARSRSIGAATGSRVRADPGAERDRQLGQGGAAHPRPHRASSADAEHPLRAGMSAARLGRHRATRGWTTCRE